MKRRKKAVPTNEVTFEEFAEYLRQLALKWG